MAELKHTPGPWRAARNAHYWEIRAQHFGTYGDGQIGDACASLCDDDDWRSEELGRANAHLMAAAPDLYAAVQALLPEDWRDGVMDHMPGVKQAREALDKADGGPPEIGADNG